MAQPESINWSEIRQDFPALQRYTYLNAGMLGLPSKDVTEARVAWIQDIAESGYNLDTFEDFEHGIDDIWIGVRKLRAGLAQEIGTSSDNLFFTRNTTESLQATIEALGFQEGDTLLATDMEHEAAHFAVELLGPRKATVEVAQISHLLNSSGFNEKVVEAIASRVTSKTRLVVASEVLYSFGACLPIKEIAEACKAQNPNVRVLVDGAQAFGQRRINVADLGADFYGASNHKWFGAPLGSGFLYVSDNSFDAGYIPLINGYSAAPEWLRENGLPESGTGDESILVGLNAALEYYQYLGITDIESRIKHLQGVARDRLGRLNGARILGISLPEHQTGFTFLHLPFMRDPNEAEKVTKTLLHDFDIVVRSVDHPHPALRISTHYFNNEEDIDRLYVALNSLASS